MDTHEEQRRAVQLRRKANEERFENHSKETLKRNIKTKIKTTMIGAISKFEEVFGSLWGHGLDESELTEDQYLCRERWNYVRTEILNNGNNQSRGAMAEIDQNTVRYNKTRYNFDVKLTKDQQEL